MLGVCPIFLNGCSTQPKAMCWITCCVTSVWDRPWGVCRTLVQLPPTLCEWDEPHIGSNWSHCTQMQAVNTRALNQRDTEMSFWDTHTYLLMKRSGSYWTKLCSWTLLSPRVSSLSTLSLWNNQMVTQPIMPCKQEETESLFFCGAESRDVHRRCCFSGLPGSSELHLHSVVQRRAAELKFQHEVNLKTQKKSRGCWGDTFHLEGVECEWDKLRVMEPSPCHGRTFDWERNTG